MANIKQSEQAVLSSMKGKVPMTGASVSAEIVKQADSLSSNLVEPFTEIGSAISSSLKMSPTTINSFWQETENMIIGSQEWNAAYQNLSFEKQSYLQSYGRLYDYINNSVNVSGTNYNFAADSSGLAEMSTYLEKVSLEVEEVIYSIYAEINSIQENEDWEGEAFLAFQSNCLKYKEPLLHLVLLIRSFASIFASLGEETDTLVKSIVSVVNGCSLNIKPSFQQPLTPYQLRTQFDEYNMQNKMKKQQDVLSTNYDKEGLEELTNQMQDITKKNQDVFNKDYDEGFEELIDQMRNTTKKNQAVHGL